MKSQSGLFNRNIFMQLAKRFTNRNRAEKRNLLSFYNEKIKRKKDVPFYFKERLKMRDKMKKKESKDVYRLRKSTVEPVIGNVKQNLSFREFSLRGLDKAKIELNLVSIAHNLGKIWRLTRTSER